VLGEQLLKEAVRRVNSSVFRAPRVVMHPLGEPQGGLTQIEVRALQEMAMGAGARKAQVWVGRPLTDGELLSGQFPAGGQLLA
jgi:rod shape-determining protein MreB and related proteins